MRRPCEFVSVVAMLLLVSAAPAQAKDVEYEKTFEVRRRAETVVKILTDYEAVCDEGCKYRFPSVKEIRILRYKRTPRRFYTWSFVEDTKNMQWYSLVTIEGEGRQRTLTLTMVDEATGKSLEKRFGKPHDPLFDTLVTRYRIREVFEAGTFRATKVTFWSRATVTGLISLFSGSVRSGFEESAREALVNITRRFRAAASR